MKTKPTEETALFYYMNASIQKKADILYCALGLMESDNSRGKQKCITMAVMALYGETKGGTEV